MSSSKEPTISLPISAETRALLGPPPVLSTESTERFNEMFNQLVACLKPQDLLELMAIRDFAVASWEAERYTGHRTLSFNRRFRRNLEHQVQELRARHERRRERASNYAQQSRQVPSDIAGAAELERRALESNELEEVLKRTPSELDHNEAIEKTIALHKDLEFLISSLTKRKNEALEMLDRYRKGLGKRTLSEVLEGEFNEVDAPAQLEETAAPKLIPTDQSEPDTDDVGTENSSEQA